MLCRGVGLCELCLQSIQRCHGRTGSGLGFRASVDTTKAAYQ